MLEKVYIESRDITYNKYDIYTQKTHPKKKKDIYTQKHDIYIYTYT